MGDEFPSYELAPVIHQPITLKNMPWICQSMVDSAIPQGLLVVGLVKAGNSLIFVFISIKDRDQLCHDNQAPDVSTGMQ